MAEAFRPERSLLRHLAVKQPERRTEQANRERFSNKYEGKRAGWGIHDSSIPQYGRTFQSVIGSAMLGGFLQERAIQNGYETILDLMASETVVGEAVELGYKGGVAVSLGFPHDPMWDRKFGQGVVHTVNSDVASVEGWSRIQAKQKEIAPKGFDVIVSRPEGGINPEFVLSDPTLYFLMLQKMWKITASGGVMLFQVPHKLAEISYEYFKQLIDIGVEIKLPPLSDRPNTSNPFRVRGYFGFPVRVEKSLDAPKRLPQPVIEEKFPLHLKPHLKLVGIE